MRHFHSTKRFIDDNCAIIDGEEFEKSICEKYQKEFEFGYDHHGGPFIYKLFNKRNYFPFSIVIMSHIERNIPQNVFIQKSKVNF